MMDIYILILICVNYICIEDSQSTYSFYVEDGLFMLITEEKLLKILELFYDYTLAFNVTFVICAYVMLDVSKFIVK
jgi:hypothetical protein